MKTFRSQRSFRRSSTLSFPPLRAFGSGYTRGVGRVVRVARVDERFADAVRAGAAPADGGRSSAGDARRSLSAFTAISEIVVSEGGFAVDDPCSTAAGAAISGVGTSPLDRWMNSPVNVRIAPAAT